MTPEERAKAAVWLVQLVLNDMLAVLRDVSNSPDARLLARHSAQNILRWDAGTDTVEISAVDRKLVEDPLSLGGF